MRKRKTLIAASCLLCFLGAFLFFAFVLEPIVPTNSIKGDYIYKGTEYKNAKTYRGLLHRNYFFVRFPAAEYPIGNTVGWYFVDFENKIAGQTNAGFHQYFGIHFFDQTGFFIWLETPMAEFKFAEPWVVLWHTNAVAFSTSMLQCKVTMSGG